MELKGSFLAAHAARLPQPQLHQTGNPMFRRLPQLAAGYCGLTGLEGTRGLQQSCLGMQGHHPAPAPAGRDTLAAQRTEVADRGRKAEGLTEVTTGTMALGVQVGRHVAGGTGTGECFQVNLEVLLGEATPVRSFGHVGPQRKVALRKGLARARPSP